MDGEVGATGEQGTGDGGAAEDGSPGEGHAAGKQGTGCVGFSPIMGLRLSGDGKLPCWHPISHARIAEDPKALHECRVRAHKTLEYHTLHTGGFLRLCTERGRVYWCAQNETNHTAPDWKIHFSCAVDQLSEGWDVLASVYLDHAAEIGMKVCCGPPGSWPEEQRGRELTVYMMADVEAEMYADGGVMATEVEEADANVVWLGPEYAMPGIS